MSASPPPDAFPSTCWSRILIRPEQRDLDALARAYFRPVRAYLAARLRLDADAADELAQEAFAWMLATRFFDRADPARGRFRGLLKRALANFAIEHLRRAGAAKRGSGRAPEALDPAHEPADPGGSTPDEVLDAAWRRELLERARERLEAELRAGGRDTHYEVFRSYFLDPGGGGAIDYAALAARHGITRADVSNRLAYAKNRYRELLRALVVETVSGPDELDEELRWLFGPEAPRAQPR